MLLAEQITSGRRLLHANPTKFRRLVQSLGIRPGKKILAAHNQLFRHLPVASVTEFELEVENAVLGVFKF